MSGKTVKVPPRIQGDSGSGEKNCGPVQFHPGSVVRLKSGSPDMTVTAITCCGRVQTEWFDEETGELLAGEWPACCLV